jgi:hypothetical protein
MKNFGDKLTEVVVHMQFIFRLLEPFCFLEHGIYCQLKRQIEATPLL